MTSTSGSSTPFHLKHNDFPPMLGLLDFLVSVDAHLELLSRPIRKKGKNWKTKADKLLEESRLKALKVTQLQRQKLILRSEEERDKFEKRLLVVLVVSLKDKLAFFFGVMNVVTCCLLLGFAPDWIPALYSTQACLFLPYRVYSYKKKAYHYFLFDLCYAINALCLVYLWIFPASPALFMIVYGLSLGSLGTAIATWRNSLVFHSPDKVISLAIHFLPPFLMTVIRHYLDDEKGNRWRMAAKTVAKGRQGNEWTGMSAVLICMGAYGIWQIAYFRFLLVAQRSKIESGSRVTSFTWLLNDKKSLVGKIGVRVRAEYREVAFMCGQAIYTLVTLLIPIFVLYDSKFWSAIYLLVLFSVSVWNGASFYMDVFGRHFERELVELRVKFEEAQFALALARSNSLTEVDPFITTSTPSDTPTLTAIGIIPDGEGGKGSREVEESEGMSDFEQVEQGGTMTEDERSQDDEEEDHGGGVIKDKEV